MSKKKKSDGILNFILRVGFSVALLWWLFSKIDTEKTVEVLKTADLTYIIAGAIIFLGVNFILLWRWTIFIKAMDLKVSTVTVVRYFFIGLFGNLFLPSAVGGDIIKILGVCKVTHHKARVVASVLLDRLSGFAAITLVAVVSFTFGYKTINEPSILYMILFMGSGSLTIAAILFNEKIYTFCCRVFAWLPKFRDALMQMHYDIFLMKGKKGEGCKAIITSCVSQVIYAGVFFMIAKGLHQDLPFYYFLIFVPIICVAASFPSIGGLGVREAGAAFLFSKVGVDTGVAVSMSLINFLYMICIGLLGGVIYVATVSSGRIQHPAPDADVQPS